MRITMSQMTQMIVQSAQNAKAGGTLELKIGSIVQATLLDVMGNSDALIQVGPYKLTAKLDADLKPGDKMALLVTGEQKNGALELKLVGDPIRNNASQQQPLNLQSIVQTLGLPEQDSSKALVQEFLSRRLPLNPDVLRSATDALQGNSKPTAAQVATLGKMAELGIPMHQGSFQAMDALDNGPKLHELLTRVLTGLQELLPETDTGAQGATGVETGQANGTQSAPATVDVEITTGDQDSHAPATTAASSVATAPSATPATPANTTTPAPTTTSASTPPANANAETAGAGNENPFPENKIPRQLPTNTDTAVAVSTLAPETQETLTSLRDVIRDLLAGDGSAQSLGDKAKRLGLGFEEQIGQAVRRAGGDETAEQTALQNAAHVDAETGAHLKQTLLQVQAASQQLHEAGLSALAGDANNLLQNVTGQQMMQTPGQERSDLLYQFAAVPTQIGDSQQTVELHVMSRKGPNQKSIDPSNCYVLFHLDMPNLGELDIHLHIVDKVVGVRFVSDSTDNVQITPDDQRDLWAAVKGVGFHLGTVKVEEKKQPADGEQVPLLPPVLTQGALDVRM